MPPDPPILLDAGQLQLRIDQMAAEIDVARPWAHPRAKEWDAVTLGDRMRQNVLNKDVIELLNCWTQPGFGADVDAISLLFVLHYVACSGNAQNVGTFERNSNTAGGAQDSRFVGGSQRIPLRLARTLGSRVALNAPVTWIEQRGRDAFVHCKRGVVRARRVIVAAPPPTVLDIRFTPGLPAARSSLLRQMRMGQLMKCDAIYERPFWRDAGLSGFGIAATGAVRAAFDNAPSSNSVGVLLAFVGGGTWRTYGRMSRSARRAAVLQGFAAMFGEQALHPIDHVEHDWNHEHWTRGGPTAIMVPHTLSTYGPWLTRPHHRVHWAGTETSTYWTGYMDGAVRAGERAATEVRRKL